MMRMVLTQQEETLVQCDSCGVAAAPEHIRERLARLELASRYRPVHIGLLLICTAPPAAMDDDLYAWERQKAGPEAVMYIEGIFQSLGIGPEKTPAERLAEFQRRGVYLARLVECPIAAGVRLENITPKAAGVIVTRIVQSYKPGRIALLSPVAPGLAEALRGAGLGEKLIAAGKGIEIPTSTDRQGVEQVRKMLDSGIPSSGSD
jgi:hypothetical protein